MRFYALLALALTFAAPAFAQNDDAATATEQPAAETTEAPAALNDHHGEATSGNDIEIVKINDNMHVLISPMGGNVLVSSGEDGVFIVDDQLTGRSEIIENAIKNFTDKPVEFILNTHYHFDHTGGNEHFGTKDSIIVAHDNVRKRLSTKQVITYFKREMEPLSKEGLPILTFGQDISFHYNGEAIRAIHVENAHTDGDAIVHFPKQNIIAAGDTIFNNMYPFIDTEHGGSVLGMIAALDNILEMADENTVIVPGHGVNMNKTEVRAYRNMLAIISNRIGSSGNAGKTVEEIIAEKPTVEFDETHGNGIVGPEAFIRILYEDLKN